jgi:hypothetical protein
MELAQAHAHFSRALQISTDLDIASFKQFAQMRCMLFERLTGPPVPAAELARNRRLLSVRRNVPGSAEFPLGAGSELALIAGVYLRLGDRSRGMRAVDRGLIPAIVERAPLFAPELWRLKGLCSASASEAKHCLTRALDLALSQGARWLALRAATELCLGADDAATRRAASETLGKLLNEIPSEDGLFDLVRARRALELARRLDSPLE